MLLLVGKGCMEYMESICTADVIGLKDNGSVLTVFTSDSGGILDDLIITKITDDHLYVVSNAGRKEHDQRHMLRALVIIKINSKENLQESETNEK